MDFPDRRIPYFIDADGTACAVGALMIASADEAAWIQPTYGPCGPGGEPVCGADGNSYECEYYATQCAMVEVAATGLCEGDDFDDIVQPVCEDETTGAESETESATVTGDDDDDDDDKKGCRVGEPSSSTALLALLVLLRRRRR